MPKNNKGVSVSDYEKLNPVPSQRDLGQLILDSITCCRAFGAQSRFR